MSVPAYTMAVAFPANVGSGTNVTSPVEVLRVHVPSPETATLVEKHCGAVSLTSHSLNRDAANPDPESFASGATERDCPIAPNRLSVMAAGVVGALTTTVSDDDPHVAGGIAGAHVPVTLLHTAYIRDVAVPENVTNGTNVTSLVAELSTQVPSPTT